VSERTYPILLVCGLRFTADVLDAGLRRTLRRSVDVRWDVGVSGPSLEHLRGRHRVVRVDTTGDQDAAVDEDRGGRSDVPAAPVPFVPG
jgi:hypothetical protein